MRKVFNYIDSHQQDYLDELFSFLRIPSISLNREDIIKCATFLAEIMNRSGIKTKIYQTDRNPIVYGEIGDKEDAPTVLVYGHYDVQPPDPLELWVSAPFEPEIRDGKIYGRGTADDKGQLFANIKGVEAYLKVKGEIPINFKFLFEGEEEISSPSLKVFLTNNKELLKSDLLIGSDSYIHENDIPIICLGNKGMVYVEITVCGANKDQHSMRAAAVPNPIWRMVGLLNTLKGEDGIVKIGGFYDDVKPLLESEIEAVNKIPYDKEVIIQDLGIKNLVQNRTGDHYYYNLIFEPTCNIAGIWGGFIGKGEKTVLPNKVSVKIDMRLVPNQDYRDILEKLENHLVKNGYADAEIKVLGVSNPDRLPINNYYVNIIKEAVTEVWEIEPLIYPNVPGTNPSYLFAENLGLHYIMIPLALKDENSHAPNENFPVNSLIKGIKFTANIIEKFPNKKANDHTVETKISTFT